MAEAECWGVNGSCMVQMASNCMVPYCSVVREGAEILQGLYNCIIWSDGGMYQCLKKMVLVIRCDVASLMFGTCT